MIDLAYSFGFLTKIIVPMLSLNPEALFSLRLVISLLNTIIFHFHGKVTGFGGNPKSGKYVCHIL